MSRQQDSVPVKSLRKFYMPRYWTREVVVYLSFFIWAYTGLLGAIISLQCPAQPNWPITPLQYESILMFPCTLSCFLMLGAICFYRGPKSKRDYKIFVMREGSVFGPYSLAVVLSYFKQGLLLEHDFAFDADQTTADARPLALIAWERGVSFGGLFEFRSFVSLVVHNHALLLPVRYLSSRQWLKDKRTVSLMVIGCTPLVLIVLNSKMVGYVGLAAYFSALWGMFFFSVFKTSQSVARDAIRVFIQTPLLASVLISIARYVPPLETLYEWTTSGNVLMRWAGMFFAVAIIEEICKVLPVYFLARHPGRVLQPRTVVLYGIISGLGFGIWEGVAYQLSINREHDVAMAYFLNVLRLTSLPFIHAIWTGISSYFETVRLARRAVANFT